MGFPDYREGLPTLPGPPGGSLDHYRTSRRDSRHFPDFRLGLPTLPGSPGGPLDPFRTFGWVS